MNTREYFNNLKRASSKHDSYFFAYDRIFERYKRPLDGKITLVEIGVQNGGSLHWWRRILGDEARIIGIDLNPEVKALEKEGFEIYIGSQSDVNFWKNFFLEVGNVDILVDDGGHTDFQQLVTFFSCIDYIRDGGLLITEDVHTSYMPMFGNPSNFSFVSFAKLVVDALMSRSSMVQHLVGKIVASQVWSVDFYESIIVFNIDRKKSILSKPIVAKGESFTSAEYRYEDNSISKINVISELSEYFKKVKEITQK